MQVFNGSQKNMEPKFRVSYYYLVNVEVKMLRKCFNTCVIEIVFVALEGRWCCTQIHPKFGFCVFAVLFTYFVCEVVSSLLPRIIFVYD